MKTESGTPIENQPSALAGFTDIYAAGNLPGTSTSRSLLSSQSPIK